MLIEKIERQMEDFQGQNHDNVIMLIGKTGCGKSTIYNFLCGAQFYINEDKFGRTTLELLSKSDVFQEIRGGLDSTTKTPKIYYNQEYQHFIIDYPGFNDTESNDQLAIQLFFNKIVNNKKLKLSIFSQIQVINFKIKLRIYNILLIKLIQIQANQQHGQINVSYQLQQQTLIVKKEQMKN
ncbi:unnamed protein product [Paramecium octaurelia]|uniref:G domain-containing protein n=1 Tax=Paramecium octaurelia TaxID=43137 RepID=A0A8S1TVZ9_PAROT|nr:unnamed protein product [Paramecium octaurelia]